MLTEKRQGEIALAILRNKLRDEGVRVGPHIQREIPKKAKDIGVTEDELLELYEMLTRELVEETFAKKK
jgi:hypothetical protein